MNTFELFCYCLQFACSLGLFLNGLRLYRRNCKMRDVIDDYIKLCIQMENEIHKLQLALKNKIVKDLE
jgi:hypothetical protein